MCDMHCNVQLFNILRCIVLSNVFYAAIRQKKSISLKSIIKCLVILSLPPQTCPTPSQDLSAGVVGRLLHLKGMGVSLDSKCGSPTQPTSGGKYKIYILFH